MFSLASCALLCLEVAGLYDERAPGCECGCDEGGSIHTSVIQGLGVLIYLK